MQGFAYRSIDPRALFDTLDGDLESFRHLSETFLRIVPPMMQRLELAGRNGQWPMAALESHSIAGTAVLVGAALLARLARDAEALAKRGDGAALLACLPALRAEFAQAIEEVRHSVRSFAGPESA